MRNNIHVSLTGGLGNQLFQLAAGICLADFSKIQLISAFGKPRTSSDGKADICAFRFPDGIEYSNYRCKFRIVQKSVGYLLRMGIAPRSYESLFGFKFFTKVITSILTSLCLQKFLWPVNSTGTGYSEISHNNKPSLLIGYFQSYRWATNPKVYAKLKSLEISENSIELKQLYERSKDVNPLVVHIRLGDYLKEDNFGILSSNYYSEALDRMLATECYKEIWVFSDDLEGAKSLFPRRYEHLAKWISEIEKSPAKTLQAMRFGHGYVIGNSSFSWWGAFLSYNESARVIAPNPWFKGMESPKDLIPPDWERVDSCF